MHVQQLFQQRLKEQKLFSEQATCQLARGVQRQQRQNELTNPVY
jgi:hypothetical protein